MPSKRKWNVTWIPVALTVLLVFGTAWSWVSQQRGSQSADRVQTRLANFALESESKEGSSLPPCCMTLEDADRAEAALIASKEKPSSCEGCPAKSGSATLAEGGTSACCSETTSVAKKGSMPACCSGVDSDVSVAKDAKPDASASCCAGSSSSKAKVAEGEEIDPEIAAMIATVKIPQVEE